MTFLSPCVRPDGMMMTTAAGLTILPKGTVMRGSIFMMDRCRRVSTHQTALSPWDVGEEAVETLARAWTQVGIKPASSRG